MDNEKNCNAQDLLQAIVEGTIQPGDKITMYGVEYTVLGELDVKNDNDRPMVVNHVCIMTPGQGNVRAQNYLDEKYRQESSDPEDECIGGIPDSIVRCFNCKYFERDYMAKVDGVPVICAHDICTKWGRGCKTEVSGFCHLGERRIENK